MQLIGSPNAGGAETFYVRLMYALAERSHVLPVVREGSWIQEQMVQYCLPHETLKFGGLFDFSTSSKLKKLMLEYKPDVVQSWMNRASRFSKPVKGVNTKFAARLGGYYDLKYYKNMDYLIGNTKDICKYLKSEGWPEDQTIYLPNFARRPPLGFEQYRDERRAKIGLKEDQFAILIAARLHENKGVDVAIEALKNLPDNVVYLLAGEGPLKDQLIEQAKKDGTLKQIKLLGWVDDISHIASAADMWAVPSRHEPLGNVVLDAWAHSLPVVAADTMGPVSLITNQEDGLLVPVEKAQAFASAVEQVMRDRNLREKLVVRGMKTFDEKFSPEVVVEKYLNFYESISHSG